MSSGMDDITSWQCIYGEYIVPEFLQWYQSIVAILESTLGQVKKRRFVLVTGGVETCLPGQTRLQNLSLQASLSPSTLRVGALFITEGVTVRISARRA